MPMMSWKWALAIFAALFFIPAALLVNLQINNTPKIYLPKNAPSVLLQQELRTQFPDWQVLVLYFESEHLLSTETLERLESLSQVLLKDSRVEKINRVTQFEKIDQTADGFEVRDLLDLSKSESPASRLTAIKQDRFAQKFVVSPNGTAAALIVRPIPLSDSPSRLRFVDDVEALVQQQGLASEFKGAAGQIAVDVAQFRSMLRDNMRFVPATMLLGLALIWWLFRRWIALLIVAAVMSAAAQSALAVLVIAQQPFTLVAAILPPFMSAISLAFLVHLFGRLQHLSRLSFTHEARVKEAARHVFKPSLFAALTTAAGLGSLAVSTIQPVEWFGIAGAVATLVLFVLVNLIVPPLMIRFDSKPWPKEPRNTQALKKLTIRCAKFASRKAGWVIALTVLTIAAAMPLLFKVKTETDIYHFFTDEHPINQVTHRVENNLSGVMPLDIVFFAKERDELKDPEKLRYIEAFQAFAAQHPSVNYSISAVDIIKEMHWAFMQDGTEVRAVPESRPLVAQYALIYDGKDLYDVVNRDYSIARLSLALTVHSSSEIRATIAQFKAWIAAHPSPFQRIELASEGRLFTDQETLLVQGQVDGLYASMGMIFLFFYLLWRRFSLATLAMLPNIAPIFWVFAMMGAFAIRLDMATALIAGVALGVAVDDTIHFTDNYREHLTAGRHHAQAILRTMAESGKACMINTVIIASQFSLLLSSDFVPTRYFGLLTAFGLVAAAVFELLLLPALLTVMSQHQLTRRWLA